MKNRFTEFCLRWFVVFSCLAAGVFITSGIVMHWVIIRALLRWL